MEPTTSVVSDQEPRILIIDSMPLRRTAMQSFLQLWADGSGLSLLPVDPAEPDACAVQVSECHMAIVNLGGAAFDDVDSHRFIEQLHASAVRMPIVVLVDRNDPNDIISAFRSGVRGFIPTNTDPPVVLQALTFILSGGHFYPPAVLLHASSAKSSGPHGQERRSMLDPDGGAGGLTARQQQVLELLKLGESNKVIARHLNMREATVKVHVRQIMRKLGVSNRTQAALVGALDPIRTEPVPDNPGDPPPAPNEAPAPIIETAAAPISALARAPRESSREIPLRRVGGAR